MSSMMKAAGIRDWMEQYQIIIYFIAVLFGGISAVVLGTTGLEKAINPALALMLYVTFLQVPVTELGAAFRRGRFIAALLLTNFLVIPLLVALLVQFLPPHPLLLLGVLLVLLTPCIDYVVTFSQLGRADSRLLLAATPLLLIAQILLLPVYLRLFIGSDAATLIHPAPFIAAFVWLIAVPLCVAAGTQLLARRSTRLAAVSAGLGILPVPATALVLYIVVAGMLPQLGAAWPLALQGIPVYIAFALLAPVCGWGVAQLFGLQAPAARAIAFSGATRNSLVILPLALAVPGAIPVLPAVIVAQTMVELLGELLYIRLIPKLGDTRR